jgi:hypothetical protein
MRNLKADVQAYVDDGWPVVPLKSREKRPKDSGWQTRTYTAADFDPDDNVGVKLGLGIYDVDLDDRYAAVAAKDLLLSTGAVFGRPGKPDSHYLYQVAERISHTVFADVDGKNLVELRGCTKDGEHTQTVIPPSVHPTGDPIAWKDNVRDEPGRVTESRSLQESVRNVAIATLVARHFPAVHAGRHNARLALAGFLSRAGVEDMDVVHISRAVANIVGGDVNDAVETARTTVAKLKSGDAAVTGGPKLRTLLSDGDKVVARLNEWLGRENETLVEQWLDRINERYFRVAVGTKMVVAEDDGTSPIKVWKDEDFRKKFESDFLPGKKGRGQNVADMWFQHPQRRRYEHFVYAPPPMQVGANDYNGWRGFTVDARSGDWSRNLTHVRDVICSGSDDLTFWVLNWCAALVQRPGDHAVSALVLRGGQGVGKGYFAKTMLGGLFDARHFAHISDRGQFYGRFNDILSGRCLVFLDEATWGGHKNEVGTLKGRVTEDTLNIERKGLPIEQERSMLHIIIASNEDWPIGIDHDDRRFCVLDVSDARRQDIRYFRDLHDELERGGRRAMLHDLLNLDVDWDALRTPPMTHGKAKIQDMGRGPVDRWVVDALYRGTILSPVGFPPHPGRSAWDGVDIFIDEAFQDFRATEKTSSLSLRQFAMRFNELVRGRKFRKNGRRGIQLESLVEARARFDRVTGIAVEWESGLYG